MKIEQRTCAMDERVKFTMEGGVADVRLTRADKMNALDDAMFEALVATGERLNRTKGLRAVVLSTDPRAEALALAREIAGNSPDAIRAAKRLLNTAVTSDVASGLMREATEQ